MKRILFITWDGPQVSYLEGLFLPIFRRLSEYGYKFHILQFTWDGHSRFAERQALCHDAGIPYRSVMVNRSLGAAGPFLTAVLGARHISHAVRDWSIDTIMPRSLMPALAVLSMPNRKGLRLVFDADGFAADEKADFFGMSRLGVTYKLLRWIEARSASLSDRVLVRTPKAIDILAQRANTSRTKFFVVGNGKEPGPYLSDLWKRTDSDFRLCYAGSIGPQYCPREMVELALILRRELPNLRFHVLTRDAAAFQAEFDGAGVGDRSWFNFAWVPPHEMPSALMQCDLGIALRKPAFSTQGVAPIKIGEYLLAGLPIVATEGIGLVEPAIEAGVAFPVRDDFTHVPKWIKSSILPDRAGFRKRAQEIGLAYFSLDASVSSYLTALS